MSWLIFYVLVMMMGQLPFDMSIPYQEDPSEPYDGYYDHFEQWVPGVINNDTWYLSAPQYTIGNVVWYAPGIMKETAGMRGMSLDGYVDGIAMMSPADIGKTAWLKRPGSIWEGPFLVVDCARRGDMFSAIYYRGEVAELGFKTAKRWGMASGKAGNWQAVIWRWDDVEVWLGDSPVAGNPIDYVWWWLLQVEFTDRWEPRPIMEGWVGES